MKWRVSSAIVVLAVGIVAWGFMHRGAIHDANQIVEPGVAEKVVYPDRRTTPHDKDLVETLFGGKGGSQLLVEATLVTAWTLSEPLRNKADDRERIHEYSILTGPMQVEPALAHELAMILKDDMTYEWKRNREKLCYWYPEVLVRFETASSKIDVTFSFECNDLEVRCDSCGERSDMTPDFAPARAQLVRLMQRIFPGHEVLQANDRSH